MYTKHNYISHIEILCCNLTSRQNVANFKLCEMSLHAKSPMEILKSWHAWMRLIPGNDMHDVLKLFIYQCKTCIKHLWALHNDKKININIEILDVNNMGV